MPGVPKTIAELNAVVEALTLRVEALEKKPTQATDAGDIAKQVQANSVALAKARSDLDTFLADANESIQLIELFGQVLQPLLNDDRPSAIEQVRRWQRR